MSVRILLGPRRGQIDTVKEVLTTAQGSPLYILGGDTERLGYQTFAFVEEVKVRTVEQIVKEAHHEDFTQQNTVDPNGSMG